MARTIEEIRSEIKTKARTFPSLDSLLFLDDTGAITGSNFIDLTETFIQGIQSFELVAEAIKAELNEVALSAPSGNQSWIQSQINKFQFGDTITIDDNFVVSYPIVDTSKQIITRCSVTVDDASSLVQIKVAKNDPPEPLSSTELDALKDYYFGDPLGVSQGVGFAGAKTEFVNKDSDKIYIEGVIRYDGEFDPATVKTNVIEAIENFLKTFTDTNFNGTIKTQDITAAILAVDGVSRFEYATNGVRGRDDATAFANATDIGLNGFYKTVSGYAVSEDTSGNTLSDSITTLIE